MIVSGQTAVAATPAELWAVLSDPARLGAALPGAGDVSVADEHHFSAVARPVTALGETRVAMDFEIAGQRPGEYVRIVGSGSSGESRIELSITLELAPDGDGTTASWRADLLVRGVLASLLQRGIGELLREQVEAVLAAGAALSGTARRS